MIKSFGLLRSFFAEPWALNRQIQQKMIALEVGLNSGLSKHEFQSSCSIQHAMISYIKCSKNFNRLGNTGL